MRNLFKLGSSAFVISLLVTSCGFKPSDHLLNSATLKQSPQIYGGTTIAKSNPAAAGLVLLHNEDQNTYCSGVLIRSDLVLTAAHCVVDKKGRISNELKALFVANKNASGPTISVSKTLSLKDYSDYEKKKVTSSTPLNDLAIAKLSELAPESEIPQRLNIKEDGSAAKEATAIGYGVTKTRNSDYGTLRAAKIQIAKFKSLSPQFSFDSTVYKQGICHGDSGGPIFETLPDGSRIIIGISISGYGGDSDTDCSRYGYATNISYYLDLLNQLIQQIDQ